MSAAYFICLGELGSTLRAETSLNKLTPIVLDPNVKDLYCRHRWEPEQYTAGMTRLQEVVSGLWCIFVRRTFD